MVYMLLSQLIKVVSLTNAVPTLLRTTTLRDTSTKFPPNVFELLLACLVQFSVSYDTFQDSVKSQNVLSLCIGLMQCHILHKT